MKKLQTSLALVAATLLVGASSVLAQQQPPQRVSPAGISGSVIEGNRVTVFYSRPYTKDPKTGEARTIWGGLVPFDKVWRTGANEATLMTVQKEIKIGDVTVPAGAYSLFTIPKEDGATLIINKQVGQHGMQHDEKQDLGRVEMKKESTEKPVDQFTITVSKNPDGEGGVLRMMWADRQYSVPFTNKK